MYAIPLKMSISVSLQAVSCKAFSRVIVSSIASGNNTADSRLKTHPKGVNQHAQPGVVVTRQRMTLPAQRRLVLNALVNADNDILRGIEY